MISQQPGTSETPPTFSGNGFETSLAPREGDLLSLPFDQYGRMRIAQDLADALYVSISSQPEGQTEDTKLRVLDVGGFPGTLRHFLSEDRFEFSVLDVVPDDGSIPGYTRGSGMDLPFGDASF